MLLGIIMQIERLIGALNNRNRYFRYKLVKKIKRTIDFNEVNNSDSATLFLRSTYSFSSYSPAMLAYMGYKGDYALVGLYDIESLEGAKEFKKSCSLFGLATCLGTGIRVSAHIETGNYSTAGIIGISQDKVKEVQKFLKPYRDSHKDRIKKLVDVINKKLQVYGFTINFVRDVCSLTKIKTGGTVIDRHVWLALANKLISLYGKGEKLIEKLISMKMDFSEHERELLQETTSAFYTFDLARIVKEKIKIDIKVEKSYKEVIKFAHSINALALYELRYVSKDKQEEIVKKVKNSGYDVLAFNPRTMSQDEIISFVKLCNENELICLPLEIIDFPRKKFDSVIQDKETLKIVRKNAWAVCGYGYLGDKGEVDLNTLQTSFEKKIDILAGISHPQYYNKD